MKSIPANEIYQRVLSELDSSEYLATGNISVYLGDEDMPEISSDDMYLHATVMEDSAEISYRGKRTSVNLTPNDLQNNQKLARRIMYGFAQLYLGNKGGINEARKKDEWNGLCHDPQDTHFAVNKKTKLIINGWPYGDEDPADLRSDKKYYFSNDLVDYGFNPSEYTIWTREYCKRNGVDPDNIQCWSNDGYTPLGVYSTEKWDKDGELNLKPGTAVAAEIVWQLIEDQPPHYYQDNLFQAGEPAEEDPSTGDPLYMTFEKKTPAVWIYKGVMPDLNANEEQ